MKSIFEQNGGTYTKVGDFCISGVTLSDTSDYIIGKCGRLRRNFLKEHYKSYYTYLLITGKKSEHSSEIDKTCIVVCKI